MLRASLSTGVEAEIFALYDEVAFCASSLDSRGEHMAGDNEIAWLSVETHSVLTLDGS